MEYTGPFMREESFVDTAKQCPTGLTASFQFTYNVTSESVHLTTLKWFDVQSSVDVPSPSSYATTWKAQKRGVLRARGRMI